MKRANAKYLKSVLVHFSNSSTDSGNVIIGLLGRNSLGVLHDKFMLEARKQTTQLPIILIFISVPLGASKFANKFSNGNNNFLSQLGSSFVFAEVTDEEICEVVKSL